MNLKHPRPTPGASVHAWTVLELAGRTEQKSQLVLARCRCGYEAVRHWGSIVRGISKCCARCAALTRKRTTRRPQEGDRYGAWEVLRGNVRLPGRQYRAALVRCRCGLLADVRESALIRGSSMGCRSCARKYRAATCGTVTVLPVSSRSVDSGESAEQWRAAE